MYRVAIIGESLAAQVAALASSASGFEEINRFRSANTEQYSPHVYSLGANASRLLRALAPEAIDRLGFIPDRYQVRFAKSAYLLAELPIGEFYQQRYGSPLVNLPAAALAEYLEQQIAQPMQDGKSLESAESSHELTVLASPERARAQPDNNPQFLIYQASLPDHPLRKANVLWRGDGQYVEQLADSQGVHFQFVTRADRPINIEEWHPSLHDAVARKTQVGTVFQQQFAPSNTLFAGRVAYLHSALAQPLTGKTDAGNTALEDAWVLSRMMDNYEEDIGDGLAAYERFRRPRHRKVAAQTLANLLAFTEPSVSKRFSQHLGMALQNRLLPEIALAKQDWLYDHDVIRGFR